MRTREKWLMGDTGLRPETCRIFGLSCARITSPPPSAFNVTPAFIIPCVKTDETYKKKKKERKSREAHL